MTPVTAKENTHVARPRSPFLPFVGALISIAMAFVACTACSSIGPTRVGPVASPSSTVGPNPTLAEPEKKLLPVVQVATATGWPAQCQTDRRGEPRR